MNLEEKTAIVTGAGRGIGKAIALSLARHGARVVLAARTRGEIDAVAKEIQQSGGMSLAVQADVSLEADVNELVKATIDSQGTVDILINNAGIGAFGRVDELPVKDFDRMWQVNMRGVFLCSRAVIPHMRKQKSGDIVNIASLAGRNAF